MLQAANELVLATVHIAIALCASCTGAKVITWHNCRIE
jgi:hypothetical protein